MKKTYITTMPDHIGAFLRASECFTELGVNITRVSYNKAVDTNTLFIDAEGTEEQLLKADEKLAEIGYLHDNKNESSIVLIEFCLRDVPGSVTEILRLINKFKFNISYISSQENGTEYQLFKMGLYVDDEKKVSEFIESAETLCRVRVIDYNRTEKVYDNSIFYNSFVNGLVQTMKLTEEARQILLVNVNLAMQTLDEHGLSPYRTFDSISKFADILAAQSGENFLPRITEHSITDKTKIVLIEPPCGSNTTIIISGGEVLFVDSGYACYREEMLPILRKILPGYDSMHKRALITHADIDHCGLLPDFDEIIVSRKSAECLTLEYEGKDGFREQSLLHKPYINICKELTSFIPPAPEKFNIAWDEPNETKEPLSQIGYFDFGELHFEVYEGLGGHLLGEIVLIDYTHHIAFTGDIYINLKGLTPQQAEYNKYAPILMTSVDTNRDLCTAERNAVLQRLGIGNWQIFSGHGYKKDYNVGQC